MFRFTVVLSFLVESMYVCYSSIEKIHYEKERIENGSLAGF